MSEKSVEDIFYKAEHQYDIVDAMFRNEVSEDEVCCKEMYEAMVISNRYLDYTITAIRNPQRFGFQYMLEPITKCIFCGAKLSAATKDEKGDGV